MTVRVSGYRARRRRVHRPDRDGGAAAVEFALVVPILVLLLFGIIDYGLWFSDTLSVRSGVHDAARQAVVANFGSCPDKPSAPDGERIACTVHDRIGGVTGDVYVKVALPAGWTVDKQVVVCAMVKENGITGYVPLPDDHYIRARSVQTIEQLGSGTVTAYADTPPSGPGGADPWAWCMP